MTGGSYGPDEARGIWVYLEHRQGHLEGISRELLGKARELADGRNMPATALALGRDGASLAAEAIAHGADRVLVADHPLLEPYTTEAHARVAAEMIRDAKPEILLLGATPDGRDLAGRLAVRLRTGLTADCTDLALDPENGLLLSEVVGFGGGIVATITCAERRPQMATVRPGVFRAPEPKAGRAGAVETTQVQLSETDLRATVLSRVVEAQPAVTEAERLVVGGGGMDGDFTLLEQLAHVLHAEIGATRVAVDAGWAEHSVQIGQTGVVTHPRLAVVCGTSGAMQFTVGIDDAETVVAVNTDPEAPIFECADYCVVGDLFQLLPPLIREVEALCGATTGTS